MLKLIVALLGVVAILFAAVTFWQIRQFEQTRQAEIDQQYERDVALVQPGAQRPDKPAPEVEAERQRLREQGRFYHALPAVVWGAIGVGLLLLSLLMTIIGRKRRRTTRLEAVTSLRR